MDNIRKANRNLEVIAWGALFVWWGITEMVGFLPDSTGLIGIGLILLGLNAARYRSGIHANGLTTTLGILALVWGGLEVAGAILSLPFELPVLAILMIVLGGIVLGRELIGGRDQ